MLPSSSPDISAAIIAWSKENPRILPWKVDQDPYKIWISEIILQQTRVAQGLPYFVKFIEAFPTICDLALADIDRIYKLWEGLGYYRRAKHMHITAQDIHFNRGGIFPSTYEELLQLKGVGPYTAAAVASFAFDQPVPVIDGNVNRVVARLFGISDPIDSRAGAKQIAAGVAQIFDARHPAEFNQAIMDFGALQCVPNAPDCHACPLNRDCVSLATGVVDRLPIKKVKRKRRERHFYYLLITDEEAVWVRKRQKSDIWQNLYEFYLIESDKPLEWSQVRHRFPSEIELISLSDKYQQLLTHQKIYATFAQVKLNGHKKVLKREGFVERQLSDLGNLAFPKVIDCYLRDKALNLNLAF